MFSAEQTPVQSAVVEHKPPGFVPPVQKPAVHVLPLMQAELAAQRVPLFVLSEHTLGPPTAPFVFGAIWIRLVSKPGAVLITLS